MIFALLAAGSLLFSVAGYSSGDAAQKARELDALRARIQSLQQDFEANRKKKSRGEQELRDIERRISEASRSLKRMDRDLKQQRRQLKELRAQAQTHNARLDKQRKRLAEEARAAYAMGHQQQVKLLLNQEEPAAVSRMLVYFGYFSRARMEQIDAMRTTLQQLRETESSIEQKTASLTQLRSRQQAESRDLLEQKTARKQLLSRIGKQLKTQDNEIDRLKSSAQELQTLLHSLQELLSDIPADASQQRPFRTLKGKLVWPARGRIASRFGTERGYGGLKWRGVLINAPEGADVQAVSQGRVAFADWLRGFGLLLIVDHGDGYMSLYGHNQAMYKEVGEWVDTGEVIATTGSSGGQAQPGLYFELRHKGRPVNPVLWCAGKPVPFSG